MRAAAAIAAAAALTGSCGGSASQEPAPRAVDTAAIAETDLVAAVLDECHRPLRGRLDRIAATVRLPDGTEVRLFAMLPDKLRTAQDTERFLLVKNEVVRIGEPPQPPTTAAESGRVRQLRTLLDGAALGPLHRAQTCRRLGPTEFELAQPDGTSVRLRLRAGTLLPLSLQGPAGEVRILDHLRTSTTWMAKRVELDGLGTCEIRFDLAGLDWDAAFFEPHGTRPPATTRPDMQLPVTSGAEPRSPVPILIESRAAQWVVVADPMAWPNRVATYRPLHAELERQNQQVAGFALFFREGERRLLAVPFRPRADGPLFTTPDGWTIREAKASRCLVVYPPAGNLEARIAAGEALLANALSQHGLETTGPITAQPFFHLHRETPTGETLQAPTVRMSVPVK